MLAASPSENHSKEDLCNLNATEIAQGNSQHSITSQLLLLQSVINNEASNCLWYMIHI